LIVSIDSNVDLSAESPMIRFVDRVLALHQDAKLKLLAMHHGPLSSGHHGGHPQGESLLEVARKHGAHAFVAGHDHLYERIVQDGLTAVISGGGGAPLYPREHWVHGSLAFSSTYNWVLLDGPELTAYSLEGVVLDRGRIPPLKSPPRTYVLEVTVLVGILFFGMFVWVVSRILRGRVR
jgi:hypothetical protein